MKIRTGTEMLQKHYKEEWAEIAATYHANPDSFYESWWYLSTHPIYNDLLGHSYFNQNLWLHVTKVDPQTLTIEDDKTRNTLVEIWLESGPIYLKSDAPENYQSECMDAWDVLGVVWNVHDYRLDTGGNTYELAIIDLARLVSLQYGDDRSSVYTDVGDGVENNE